MPKNSQVLVDIGQGLFLMLGFPRIATWKTEDRPTKVKAGTFGFNTQTSNLEYWDGTEWLGSVMEPL